MSHAPWWWCEALALAGRVAGSFLWHRLTRRRDRQQGGGGTLPREWRGMSTGDDLEAEARALIEGGDWAAVLRAGMTRRELSRHWDETGGADIRTRQEFSFGRCPRVQIGVEFEPCARSRHAAGWDLPPWEDERGRRRGYDPDDTVKRFRGPYLVPSVRLD